MTSAGAWPVRALAEVLDGPVRNGLYKPKRFHGRGVKVVNMAELFEYDFIADQPMRRIEITRRERSFLLNAGDLLFARRSLLFEGSGKCSLVTDLDEPTTFESSIIRARPRLDAADPAFLYYYFRSSIGRASVLSIASRTAVSGIRGSDLSRLQVPIPDLQEQRRIGGLLSTIDALAQSYERHARLLEEIGRLIHTEWFVRRIWPDSVATMGGTRVLLRDLAVERRESVDPAGVDPKTPYVGLEHIPRRSLAMKRWGVASEVQSTKLAFRRGEVLFGKIRPYFHKVSIAPTDGITSSDTIVIEALDPNLRPVVVSTVSSDEFVATAVRTSNGTKMPRANWKVLLETEITLPPEPLLRTFLNLVGPMHEEIVTLSLAARTLRSVRDLLLPRLVSGRVSADGPQETGSLGPP